MLTYCLYPEISVTKESKASFKLLNIGRFYFMQNQILFFHGYFNKASMPEHLVFSISAKDV